MALYLDENPLDTHLFTNLKMTRPLGIHYPPGWVGVQRGGLFDVIDVVAGDSRLFRQWRRGRIPNLMIIPLSLLFRKLCRELDIKKCQSSAIQKSRG